MPHRVEEGRHEPQLEGGVQHLIIQGAVDTNEVDAGVGLRAPGARLRVGGGTQQGVRVDGARPVGLQGLLHLAGGA